MNSLTDREIVDALYAASQDGVAISLNVRGMCALRPGVQGLSDKISVVSIVYRFLEHSRIYYRANGGDDEVYLSSADWMTRNLDKRIELMFPIERAEHKAKIILCAARDVPDNVKARWLSPDGSYQRRTRQPDEAPFRVQEYLQEEAKRAAAVASVPASSSGPKRARPHDGGRRPPVRHA